jgi:hypothetical protein
VTIRERLDRARNRPFSLAAELRVLSVGLFAVAGAGWWLSRSQDVAPVDVVGAAAVVVAMFVVNVTVGLVSVRRAARRETADAVES